MTAASNRRGDANTCSRRSARPGSPHWRQTLTPEQTGSCSPPATTTGMNLQCCGRCNRPARPGCCPAPPSSPHCQVDDAWRSRQGSRCRSRRLSRWGPRRRVRYRGRSTSSRQSCATTHPVEGESFPSGHAAIAFTAAGLLGPHLPSAAGKAAYAVAAGAGLIRVSQGAHHPIDLVGGTALGIAVSKGLRAALRP